VCCFVFIKLILGNHYGPGVIPEIRGPGVAGSSTFTLTTSLVTPVRSFSSSNGPTTTPLTTRGLCPGGGTSGSVGCTAKVCSASLVRFTGMGTRNIQVLHVRNGSARNGASRHTATSECAIFWLVAARYGLTGVQPTYRDAAAIFFVFGSLCHHTASNSITTKMHTRGAQ